MHTAQNNSTKKWITKTFCKIILKKKSSTIYNRAIFSWQNKLSKLILLRWWHGLEVETTKSWFYKQLEKFVSTSLKPANSFRCNPTSESNEIFLSLPTKKKKKPKSSSTDSTKHILFAFTGSFEHLTSKSLQYPWRKSKFLISTKLDYALAN